MTSHSENFIKVKKLHFEKGLPFTEVNIKFEKGGKSTAKIKLGKKEEVEGDEPDLIELAWSIKSTIRDGKKKLVDLSSLPIKSGQKYYDNMDIFLKDSDPEGKIKKLVKEMVEDVTKRPTFNLKKGIIDILNKKFDTSEAQEILSDYNSSKAYLLSQLALFNNPYQIILKKRGYSKNFNDFSEASDKIFREKIRSLPSIQALKTYDSICLVDIYFVVFNLSREMANQDQIWGALYKETGGKLSGEMGIHKKLSDYEVLYELTKDLLRDLAVILDKGARNVDVNNKEKVREFLTSQGYSSLVSFIEPHLRHGKAHVSVEYNGKTGEATIYDSVYKNRKVLIKKKYSEILDACKKMEELALALVLNHLVNELIILFMVLDSPDFKFFVVENKSK